MSWGHTDSHEDEPSWALPSAAVAAKSVDVFVAKSDTGIVRVRVGLSMFALDKVIDVAVSALSSDAVDRVIRLRSLLESCDMLD